ncbi:MAG: hypothetical protein KGL55_03260, partial [Rhodospirillales bacterium]|nr:hypothetical protein [Rhodospirillales bacterium]
MDMPSHRNPSTPSCHTLAQALGAIALLCAGLPHGALAQAAPLTPAMTQELSIAGTESPAALLRALDQLLKAHPDLAATPERALPLARAAAAPVGGFVGATLPTYRAITERIAAAAPPAQAQAVRAAVAAELGRLAAADVHPAAPGVPGAI